MTTSGYSGNHENEPTFAELFGNQGVNELLDRSRSDAERAERAFSENFDEQLNWIGEPLVAPMYPDRADSQPETTSKPFWRSWSVRAAVAAVILIMAYSTHQAYARHQLRLAIEKTREGVTEELGDLGRFRFGDMIPPEQTEAISRARKLVAEFYERYPRHSLSENDRNLMDQTEAFLLYVEGKPSEAVAIIPHAADGIIEVNRQTVLAVAHQQLGEWEEAANAWKFLYDNKEMEAEERTIIARSYVSCLVSAERYEEARAWNDQVMTEAIKEVNNAPELSTKRAYAYDRLAKDYCIRALIIEETTRNVDEESDALQQAMKAIGQALRITTKQKYPDFDIHGDFTSKLHSNADLLKTYLFVLEKQSLRLFQITGTRSPSLDHRIGWVVETFEKNLNWESLYLLRAHYAWQVGYQKETGDDQARVKYALKYVEAEESLWEKLGRRMPPLSIGTVVDGATVATKLNDLESVIRLSEYIVQHSDRVTINSMGEGFSMDPYAALLNNIAHGYTETDSSSREELLRALQYAKEARELEPDRVEVIETLEAVQQRLKKEGIDAE